MKNKKKGFFLSLESDDRLLIVYLGFLAFMFLFAIIGTIIEGAIK